MENRKRKAKCLQSCSNKSANVSTKVENKAEPINEIDESNVDEEKVEDRVVDLHGIPLSPPCQLGNSGVTFILEKASLSRAYVGKRYRILSSNEHADYLRRKKLNPYDYRPDIVYEVLRAVLDSPLNKAGMMGVVYVKTDSGLLFKVKPHTRIPRTCKRFCGVILELLEKSRVCSKDTGEVLMQVIKDPLLHHLPKNAHVIGLSYSSQKVVDIEDYLSARSDDLNLVFVVGTMVNGKINEDSKDDYISVSNYPLSAKKCVELICEALEQKWSTF